VSPVDRKSSIRKAPTADVVEALTRSPEAPTSTATSQLELRKSRDVQSSFDSDEVAPRRIGAGRPRNKRRMEPFSSKIEIALRDRLDEYLRSNEMTVVDFLDAAIRDRLEK
jgi:hypothetical protein